MIFTVTVDADNTRTPVINVRSLCPAIILFFSALKFSHPIPNCETTAIKYYSLQLSAIRKKLQRRDYIIMQKLDFLFTENQTKSLYKESSFIYSEEMGSIRDIFLSIASNSSRYSPLGSPIAASR